MIVSLTFAKILNFPPMNLTFEDFGMQCIVIYILIVFFLCGCKDSKTQTTKREEEIILNASIRSCENQLSRTDLSENKRLLIKSVLENRKNKTVEVEPILVEAFIFEAKNKRDYYLILWISDEEGDLEGIRIKDSCLLQSDQVTVLEEDYPVFRGGKIHMMADYHIIPVKIRQSDERKPDKEWSGYNGRDVVSLKLAPDIWISIPKPDKQVEVLVYDRAGNTSERIKVENRIGKGK